MFRRAEMSPVAVDVLRCATVLRCAKVLGCAVLLRCARTVRCVNEETLIEKTYLSAFVVEVVYVCCISGPCCGPHILA